MAVSRLRRSLQGVELVQTVMKRGYRLVEHHRAAYDDEEFARSEPRRR